MKAEQKITYKSTGFVLGNLWGGGTGAYKAKSLETNTKEELISQAKEKLADKSLDGGMGFESLIGAILYITIITTIVVDGKEFKNKEYETDFIGKLTEEQMFFLADCDS